MCQSVYTQPRNECYLLIDYHENLDDDDDFDNDYENFENDYEDFVCDVLDDHNDIGDHDDIDDHYDVDGHNNADDHYGENISLAVLEHQGEVHNNFYHVYTSRFF